MTSDLFRRVQQLEHTRTGDSLSVGLGEASLLWRHRISAIEGAIYRPLICLVVQGAKAVQAGALSVTCRGGQVIVVSHELPVLSRITEASPARPYIAFVMPLDLGILRGFHDQVDAPVPLATAQAALATFDADPDLSGAVRRLIDLGQDARAAPALAPIVLREIHARLLLSPLGAILHRLLRRDHPSSQVGRAIASIRNSVDRPLSVTDLAEHAGMSRSAFHAHFKAVTGLTPGQYQKDVRLVEARRLVLESTLAISTVAFEVGYESPAQFSRDYARKYGCPPRDDRDRTGHRTARSGAG